MKKHQFDVIVVGAGGAGLMAALYASRTANTAVLASCIRPDRIPGRLREVWELP